MQRIEDYLYLNAESYPDKIAVVCKDEKMSYSQLLKEVEHRVEVLKHEVNRTNAPLLIRTTQNIDFLVTYFAAHISGNIAVPVEGDIRQEKYEELQKFLNGCEIPRNTADILFTTGTTGRSKGVMISHSVIVANGENLAEAQGFTHSLTFIISGPLNHIGSLSKIYPVIMRGGTLYITEGIKDPNAFFRAFDYPSEKFATFLVPASIKMLMMLGENKLREYSGLIDFIETGAAAMAQSDMEQLCRLLPKSRLYNTYASTETGIICTHNFNGGKCIAGCLGRPMKHSGIFITEEGKVACTGKTLMSGYVGDNHLTLSVMHDGAVFTNDNGIIDKDGMLVLKGRSDDIINVGGFKIAPSEVEDAAMSLPEISDCVCISAPHPVMGSVLKLLVVLERGGRLDKKKIARHISAKLESYKVPFIYEAVDSIKRTYNGKIDRKFYR